MRLQSSGHLQVTSLSRPQYIPNNFYGVTLAKRLLIRTATGPSCGGRGEFKNSLTEKWINCVTFVHQSL